jgi:hypothetical protein
MTDIAQLAIEIDTKKGTVKLKEFQLETKKTTESLKGVAAQTEKTNQSFDKFSKGFSKFSGRLATFANNLNAYVVLPLVAVGGAAIKASLELNKGLANVGTLIPGQTEQLVKYKDEMKNLSIETGKTFQDLTRGLYETISAFPGTAEATQITELAAKTATAGLSTTKQALDLLSATTKAYGDTSFDAQQKVADLAFTAVKLGQNNILGFYHRLFRGLLNLLVLWVLVKKNYLQCLGL